jgi:hypothetical protein
MKKLLVILALALMLVPGIVLAQPGVTVPSYCTWNGDPCMRYGFSGATEPGIDYATIYEGQQLYYDIGLQNAHAAWTPDVGGLTCNAANAIPDTFCFEASSARGWTLGSVDPGLNVWFELPSGFLYWCAFTIDATPGAPIGTIDTVVVKMVYSAIQGTDTLCAPECGDCVEPNYRNYVPMYNADTLIVEVVPVPPVIEIRQDTLTLVDQGQTQAYIPFSICNPNETADPRTYDYLITSVATPRIPAISQTGTIASVLGGGCKDVYGVIDAGAALVCDYATLTIIAWIDDPEQGLKYDTCVQVIHIVEPEPVPLFTVPVVTILVLALILAAAVFMRRRAVSRA